MLLCPIQTWSGGGGTQSQVQGGTQSQVRGGVPSLRSGEGGTPSQVPGGYPIPGLGVPHPDLVRGRGYSRYPLPRNGMGYPFPLPGPGMGYPPRPKIGYPPGQTWDRVPPPRPQCEQTFPSINITFSRTTYAGGKNDHVAYGYVCEIVNDRLFLFCSRLTFSHQMDGTDWLTLWTTDTCDFLSFFYEALWLRDTWTCYWQRPSQSLVWDQWTATFWNQFTPCVLMFGFSHSGFLRPRYSHRISFLILW